ncbi:hypothetical protein EPUL_002088, partial [Erysiphe pulchra]
MITEKDTFKCHDANEHQIRFGKGDAISLGKIEVDTLSCQIHLTKNALNELNYQNRQLKTLRVQQNSNLEIVSKQLESIRQLAREGGPDLTDLRGVSEPDKYAMESNELSQPSRRTKQSGTKNKTKTIGLYYNNFEDILQDFEIFGYPYVGSRNKSSIVPLNLEEMIERANEPRPSVTPVTIPSSVFESFKTNVLVAKKESEVVKHLVPIIEGGIQVREDLNSKVVPTAEKTNPIAPFFSRVEGPSSSLNNSRLQAQYYGALGERGQIALRSWGHDASVLDGKAHTIACTYVSRTLTFYSIHAAKSSDIDGRIEYFMHMIDGFVMGASAFKFRNAIAAYQNLQDYAGEKRNEAI